MKRLILPAVMLAALPLSGWLLLPAGASPPSEQAAKWEYKALRKSAILELGKAGGTETVAQLAAGLNALGNEGWELVTLDTNERTINPIYIFKRMKRGG